MGTTSSALRGATQHGMMLDLYNSHTPPGSLEIKHKRTTTTRLPSRTRPFTTFDLGGVFSIVGDDGYLQIAHRGVAAKSI